jgi:hypothetical protein
MTATTLTGSLLLQAFGQYSCHRAEGAAFAFLGLIPYDRATMFIRYRST